MKAVGDIPKVTIQQIIEGTGVKKRSKSAAKKILELHYKAEETQKYVRSKPRVSFSEVNTYTSCPRKHYLRYKLGLYTKKKDYKLLVGIMVDEWTNKYYDPKWWLDDYILRPPTTEEKKEQADKYMSEWAQLYEATNKLTEDEAIDLDRACEKAQEMVNAYAKQYPHNPDEQCLATQFMVHEPVKQGVLFYGIVDRVMLINDRIYIVDTKTTSTITNDFIRKHLVGAQLQMYLWSISRMINSDIDGIIIDCLSRNIKTPIKPPLIKNGKKLQKIISSAGIKRINTTYELVLEAIEENGFNKNEYMHELAYLRKAEEYGDGNLIQFYYDFDKEKLSDTSKQFGLMVSQIRRKDSSCLASPDTTNCSMCEFKNICHQPDGIITTQWNANKQEEQNGHE